ncbi:hypothetical protein FHX74_002290 [Friedmanniella endophytica]|uniref:DUF7691 domain-containing protein n=1 Tax=Microlunatus kandeliicorticis TaxID=1759536 RepID=A0A7W3P642_9ACTN|nr:hypothetical protein [Microlunatus kandeliicorticis]MBA8794671.1 hypothetical protein [Microlunatus kandeliicorticis]
MGVLRLYAIAIDEVRSMVGARPEDAERLRTQAQAALAPPTPGPDQRHGLLGKLGPIFRRVPGTPVLDPGEPSMHDYEVLITGGYVPAERVGATWRAQERLVRENCWGTLRLDLTAAQLDDLDFALARGQVSAAYGLRHLLNSSASLSLLPVRGLWVGYHRHDTALAMGDAYRAALAAIPTEEQRELVTTLVDWLDGFPHWAPVAAQLGRPAPDLIGFWSE